jgi:hypothetical protein
MGKRISKEFLTDYEARESELCKKFLKDFRNGCFDEIPQYPPLSRFPKINRPFSQVFPYKSSIYYVLPFYGTTIVNLIPCSKEIFKVHHGFDSCDIDKIIDFSKETGKLHFVLIDEPSEYSHLVFLEKLFEELKPPLLPSIPEELVVDPKVYKEAEIEFHTIASLGFYQESLKKPSLKHFPDVAHSYDESLSELAVYSSGYAMAKSLGYNQLTDRIIDMLSERNYEAAAQLLTIAMSFINHPKLDTLKAPMSWSGAAISFMQRGIRSATDGAYEPNVEMPFEIGKFLLQPDKLTFMTGECLEACKSIIDKYAQSDLYNVMKNLEEGIRNSDLETAKTDLQDIETIIDNLWKDADVIGQRRDRLKYGLVGVPITLGVMGDIAAGFGSNLGLLAGFGFTVLGGLINSKKDKISERIAKWRQKNYMVGIFDFKQKYATS